MTNVTLREGDILSLNAPVATSVAGNHAIIFSLYALQRFSSLGTPLGALENRDYSVGIYRTGDYMRDVRLRPLAPCPVSLIDEFEDEEPSYVIWQEEYQRLGKNKCRN